MIGTDIVPHTVGHALKIFADQAVIEHQAHGERFNFGIPGWRQTVASSSSRQLCGVLEVTEQGRPRRQVQVAQHEVPKKDGGRFCVS